MSASPFTTKKLVSILSNQSEKVSYASWHFYIAQLKNMGFIKVDFSKNLSLSVTEKGLTIFTDNSDTKEKKIKLVTLDEFIEQQEKIEKATKKTTRSRSKAKSKPSKDYFKNPLFDVLRQTRLKFAQEKNIAAYMVFSDKTLLEMANEKPATKDDMMQISGVGEVKWERYGEEFLEVIAGR